MARIALLKQASNESGLSEWELSIGAKSGKYPAFRIGGERGRWAFDIDLLEARIKDLMQNNVKPEKSIVPEYGVIRKVRHSP